MRTVQVLWLILSIGISDQAAVGAHSPQLGIILNCEVRKFYSWQEILLIDISGRDNKFPMRL